MEIFIGGAMKRFVLTAAVLVAVLSACGAPDRYPLSDDTCGPNDPVQTLDARDCVMPIGPAY